MTLVPDFRRFQVDALERRDALLVSGPRNKIDRSR
jgi:hypothetical protein